MSRKRVVHIIIGLNIGGAELMLKRLVLHSSEKGKFEHFVVSLTDLGVIGQQLQDAGIDVYSVGINSFLSTSIAFIRLRKLLKKINPDVVQTWMYHADFLGGLTAKSLGIKNIIWGIRTTDVSQGASKMTVHLSKVCAKLSYYIPNTIICAAQVSKNYHIDIGYDASKMLVIPNGFDIKNIIATEEDGREIRKEIGLSSNDTVIGSVGRFNPVKDQKLFIYTAAQIIKKYPDIKFIIVGKDNTVDNVELMSWINKYDIAENFRLLGQRNDVPKCLQAMDIFCLHSKTEGFPNVLVEAMAIGLACVAKDVGDVKHIIDDYGIVAASDDVNKLIDSLLLSIDNLNKSNKKVNSGHLRRYISSKYSIDTIHEEYSKIWNN